MFQIKTGKLQHQNTEGIVKQFILFPHYFKYLPLVRASIVRMQMIPHLLKDVRSNGSELKRKSS